VPHDGGLDKPVDEFLQKLFEEAGGGFLNLLLWSLMICQKLLWM
jgi:hypothetical protein